MTNRKSPVIRIRGWKLVVTVVLVAGCSPRALADTISGTVRNQTTSQLSAGDTVILLRLAEGMQQEAQTKTGAQGEFAFNVDAIKDQRLVRVMHQGVNYDYTVGGAGLLQLTVFDAVPKIAGLRGSIGIIRVESDKATLRVTEMYSITNSSAPPVTQSSAHNFEITTPSNAVLDFVQARGPKGIWVDVQPTNAQSGQYYVDFPIRPGETLFKFAYHLPYNGPTALRLKLAYPIQRFAVMHPPSLTFKSLRAGAFINPGMTGGLQVEKAVAQPLTGAVPAFEISGTGAVTPPASAAKVLPPPASAAPAAANTTGVQLGKDPNIALEVSGNVWWLLVPGITLVLAVGVFGVRRSANKRGSAVKLDASVSRLSFVDALKEELFQLESDRLRGLISAKEYADTKQALNQNIQRAMSFRPKTGALP